MNPVHSTIFDGISKLSVLISRIYQLGNKDSAPNYPGLGTPKWCWNSNTIQSNPQVIIESSWLTLRCQLVPTLFCRLLLWLSGFYCLTFRIHWMIVYQLGTDYLIPNSMDNSGVLPTHQDLANFLWINSGFLDIHLIWESFTFPLQYFDREKNPKQKRLYSTILETCHFLFFLVLN